MIICAAGDAHGALERLYTGVLAFEKDLGVRFSWVLQVGDLGVWPDPERMDRATLRHRGPNDFASWCSEQRPVPRRTLFIKGNHEDCVWLDSREDQEVLPGLFFLPNGLRFEAADDAGALGIVGIGGCFGPSDYGRGSASLQGGARRHYTRDEIEAGCSAGSADIVLVHDAPAGVPFGRRLRFGGTVSEAVGLDELLRSVRPRVCFFGHHHARLDAEVHGVRCIGLNRVDRPGNLVAVELDPRGSDFSILGEWPAPGSPASSGT